MSTRRRISQREAHRMRARIKELEYKLRDFGNVEERISVEVWNGAPNWARTVRMVEKLGFEARVSVSDAGAGETMILRAVRRKSDTTHRI